MKMCNIWEVTVTTPIGLTTLYGFLNIKNVSCGSVRFSRDCELCLRTNGCACVRARGYAHDVSTYVVEHGSKRVHIVGSELR